MKDGNEETQSLLIKCIHKGVLPRTPAGGFTDCPATGPVGTLLCNRVPVWTEGFQCRYHRRQNTDNLDQEIRSRERHG